MSSIPPVVWFALGYFYIVTETQKMAALDMFEINLVAILYIQIYSDIQIYLYIQIFLRTTDVIHISRIRV